MPLMMVSSAVCGCQIIGGYSVYDIESERYFAVAERRATDNLGMWCPDVDGHLETDLKQAISKPKRQNLRRVDVPLFGTQRTGRVTEEQIGWREYRRGTFFDCSEPAKDTE